MSPSVKAIRVDELMHKAMQSLKAAKWFDAEQFAVLPCSSPMAMLTSIAWR